MANSINPETVAEAERARVALHHQRVAELLKDIPSFTLEMVATLPEDQLRDFMRALRIQVDAHGGRFNKELIGSNAAIFLAQAKVLLDYYYSDPHIREAAMEMRTNLNGSEYQMLAEMWRDIAHYCLKLGSLTGNTELLVNAASSFEKAINLTERDSSAGALARFEHKVLLFNEGEAINTAELYRDWQILIKHVENPDSINHDRAAKVSWEMWRVAKKAGMASIAREALKKCREHADHLPSGFIKYAARQMIKPVVNAVQRATYAGNGSELQLKAETLDDGRRYQGEKT